MIWVKILGHLSFCGVFCWQLSGLFFALRFLRLIAPPPGQIRFFKHIFHELKPFYWPLAAVTFVHNSFTEPPLYQGLLAAHTVLMWYLYKDLGGDDDRWKRRKKKLVEKITITPAGRLTTT